MSNPIDAFIAKHGIKMEATPVEGNEHLTDMPAGSRHFSCKITREGSAHEVVTPFSVGPGIVDRWIMEKHPSVTRKGTATYLRPGTLAWEGFVKEHGKKYRPDLPSVLDCLASDAQSIVCAPLFEEWATECGYDTDSRKAEKTWKVCTEQRHLLERLLGSDAFEELLDTERL